MDKISGFTLVEMLVAVSVAVILLTTGLPSFHQFNLNNRRAAQINEFVAAMSYSRSEALKRGNRVSLCRTSNYSAALPICGDGDGWEDGWVIFDNPTNATTPPSADVILQVHEPLSGHEVSLRGDHNIKTRIHYAATGRVAGTFGNLVRCDSRGAGPQSRIITFPLSGRVRIQQGDQSTDCTP